jgi:hypothetical protein
VQRAPEVCCGPAVVISAGPVPCHMHAGQAGQAMLVSPRNPAGTTVSIHAVTSCTQVLQTLGASRSCGGGQMRPAGQQASSLQTLYCYSSGISWEATGSSRPNSEGRSRTGVHGWPTRVGPPTPSAPFLSFAAVCSSPVHSSLHST